MEEGAVGDVAGGDLDLHQVEESMAAAAGDGDASHAGREANLHRPPPPPPVPPPTTTAGSAGDGRRRFRSGGGGARSGVGGGRHGIGGRGWTSDGGEEIRHGRGLGSDFSVRIFFFSLFLFSFLLAGGGRRG